MRTSNQIFMERLSPLPNEPEGSGYIIYVHKIIVLCSRRKPRNFPPNTFLDRSVHQARAALSDSIGVGDLRPNEVNTDLGRYRHTHHMGNDLSPAIDIPRSRTVSLCIGRRYRFMLHNAASTKEAAASQFFCCTERIHRPLGILELKGSVRAGRSRTASPSKMIENVVGRFRSYLFQTGQLRQVTGNKPHPPILRKVSKTIFLIQGQDFISIL